MSHLSRRGFLKGLSTAGLGGAGALLVPNIGGSTRRLQVQNSTRLGKVVVTQAGAVNFHTFLASNASFLVTSHVIETETRLVIIDTQFTQTFAREFRAYVDSLGKPIDRVILSHQHPDHLFGANNFTDAPFITTPGILAGVETTTNAGFIEFVKTIIGADEVPAELHFPEAALELGEQTVDGVVMDISIVTNTESPEEIVVRLPEVRTLIVQDLLFNNTHYYPAGDFANWIATLTDLRALAPDYDTVLVGHGMPTTIGEIDQAIEYLNLLVTTIEEAETADDAAAVLIERYPTYAGQEILFLLLPGLFANT